MGCLLSMAAQHQYEAMHARTRFKAISNAQNIGRRSVSRADITAGFCGTGDAFYSRLCANSQKAASAIFYIAFTAKK